MSKKYVMKPRLTTKNAMKTRSTGGPGAAILRRGRFDGRAMQYDRAYSDHLDGRSHDEVGDTLGEVIAMQPDW